MAKITHAFIKICVVWQIVTPLPWPVKATISCIALILTMRDMNNRHFITAGILLEITCKKSFRVKPLLTATSLFLCYEQPSNALLIWPTLDSNGKIIYLVAHASVSLSASCTAHYISSLHPVFSHLSNVVNNDASVLQSSLLKQRHLSLKLRF